MNDTEVKDLIINTISLADLLPAVDMNKRLSKAIADWKTAKAKGAGDTWVKWIKSVETFYYLHKSTMIMSDEDRLETDEEIFGVIEVLQIQFNIEQLQSKIDAYKQPVNKKAKLKLIK
jgi:hypothetical protein